MILEIKPDIGPWGEVITLLRNCDDAFLNESAASISQKGMPLNRIACVAHMLCDERFLACIIPLSDATTGSAASRPSELDQIKATGKTRVNAVYEEVHRSYKTWITDYENPFVVGHLFYDDLQAIDPKKATFKDGDAIRALVKSTILKVETTLKNHKQSGHHSSGDDRLLEIRNDFITPKGKNIDLGTFYAFLILENQDLRFVSRTLEPGIGASAGLGTVGGGAPVAMGNRKRNNGSEALVEQLNLCTKRFMETSERLFSPSPTFTDLSTTTRFGGSADSDGVRLAKESKIEAERKLLYIREQMDHHKYVLSSDFYDANEKQTAKKKLNDLVLQMEDNSIFFFLS
jgi:hypothetical protein